MPETHRKISTHAQRSWGVRERDGGQQIGTQKQREAPRTTETPRDKEIKRRSPWIEKNEEPERRKGAIEKKTHRQERQRVRETEIETETREINMQKPEMEERAGFRLRAIKRQDRIGERQTGTER